MMTIKAKAKYHETFSAGNINKRVDPTSRNNYINVFKNQTMISYDDFFEGPG